ncbi:hypothetical protein GCM10012275_16640 [Longimycelium tulufanense]|uniref:Uncharacterized protein n=1 Tax=Longimycelium tulufanense TaxID=907463 RepID=A0A8J3FT57_9PSEU|nr:hypothetical protein GCM10012275_16640 [Longimycelium tulufanense]
MVEQVRRDLLPDRPDGGRRTAIRSITERNECRDVPLGIGPCDPALGTPVAATYDSVGYQQ